MWDSFVRKMDFPGLGFKSLDSEHADLNKEALTENASLELQRTRLDRAVAFFRNNCESEELMMERDNFPDIEMHRAAHRALLRRLQWLRDDLEHLRAPRVLQQLAELRTEMVCQGSAVDRAIIVPESKMAEKKTAGRTSYSAGTSSKSTLSQRRTRIVIGFQQMNVSEIPSRERAGSVLAKIAKVAGKPGISRGAIFKVGGSKKKSYIYYVDAQNPQNIIREDRNGKKAVGRLIGGQFRAGNAH